MFGANPIPQDDAGNLTFTRVSNSSAITRPPTTEDDSKNTKSPGFDTHVSKNSSYSNTISAEFFNNSDSVEAEIIKTTGNDFVCGFYNPEFIIYSSLCSFYIPCIFMVFLYSRIFWVSIRN